MKKNSQTFNSYLKSQLKIPDFKKEWDVSEVQYQFVRQLIKVRNDQQMSQRKLARKANTTQAVISRVESLSSNPSLALVERLAQALGKRISLNLV